MIIKRLELQGFKSFLERKKITFHPGITAIIGPNGTGKSNIVDSILWVLGGKRFKSFRGERGQDIIFNGNINTPPMSMADVSLFLGDDNEELIISHRLFRSGESEYRLNSKVVRLKDIQDSLWKKAIGETEYFVIEQGSIGLFLTSKPTEKRQLLEEAAGTAFYKEKKRQTQNKLENSEQNLTRLEDILAEVLKAKNSLKRQALAAIRYRKLREKIRELTFFHYREKTEHLEKNQKQAFSEYQKSLDLEKEILSQLKSEEKKLAEKRKEIWTHENQIKQEYENLLSLKTQISRLETENERETKRIDLIKEKNETAQKNKSEFEQEIVSLEKEKTHAENNLKILKKSLEQLQSEQSSADQGIQAFQRKIDAKQKKIEALRNESLQKLSACTEIKNEKVRIEKELELIQRQVKKLESQLVIEQSSINQLEKDQDHYDKESEEIQQVLEKKQKEIVKNQNILKKTCSAIDTLQKQLSELQDTKEKKSHHLHALKKIEEKERVTDASTSIPESLGLLADLIESDADHTALVDILWKEEVKATIIQAKDFLKNLAGSGLKGNFFLLTPQKKEKAAWADLQNPNIIGLLKSHIHAGQKAKNLLSQLNEAIIVPDVRTAVEMWLRIPSANFITLEGDLLLESGLLKLGAKKEGLFSLRQDIKTLEKNIAQIDAEISPLKLQIQEKTEQEQRQKEQIQTEFSLAVQLEKKIDEIEKEKGFRQSQKERSESNSLVIEKELAVLKEESRKMAQILEAISKKIKQTEKEQQDLKAALEKEQEDFSTLQSEDKQERRLFFELKSSVDIHREKIKNLEHQIQEFQRRKSALREKAASLTQEMEDSEELQLRIQVNIQNLTKKARLLEKEKKSMETQLAKNETFLNKIKIELQGIEKRTESLREEEDARKEERVQKEIRKAERERDLVNLEEACWQELKKTLQEVKDEVSTREVPDKKTEESLAKAKEHLQKFKAVNLMAEEEYLSHKKRYDFLIQQKKDLRESIDSTKEAIRKIDKESKTQFLKALNEVNTHVKEVFSLLFEGGHAELQLTEPNDPLESGVEIVAQPPGKKLQSLTLLSGGEKSLTSLAFFFALFRYKPTPFCILDEVDAALDEINLSRFLNLMEKIKDQTQFLLITHNFKTMRVADYIYGTTMAEPNITDIYSMKLEKKEAI